MAPLSRVLLLIHHLNVLSQQTLDLVLRTSPLNYAESYAELRWSCLPRFSALISARFRELVRSTRYNALDATTLQPEFASRWTRCLNSKFKVQKSKFWYRLRAMFLYKLSPQRLLSFAFWFLIFAFSITCNVMQTRLDCSLFARHY